MCTVMRTERINVVTQFPILTIVNGSLTRPSSPFSPLFSNYPESAALVPNLHVTRFPTASTHTPTVLISLSITSLFRSPLLSLLLPTFISITVFTPSYFSLLITRPDLLSLSFLNPCLTTIPRLCLFLLRWW